MSDAFTDLRNVLRRRHDWLRAKIKRTQDDAQVKLLKARKDEIWEVWHDFLFEAPVATAKTRNADNQEPHS